LAICLVMLTMARAADAEAPSSASDPVAAEALFNAGKVLIRQGDWSGACSKFEKSMVLDAAVSTLIKIARCREHEGKIATAWYEYQRALKLNRELPGVSQRRRRELEDVIAKDALALEPRIPRLRLSLTSVPDGTAVKRNGEWIPLPALGEALPVDPGQHELLVSAPGYRTEQRSIQASEGKLTEVEIALVAQPAEQTKPALRGAGTESTTYKLISPREVARPGQSPRRDEPSNGRAQRIAGIAVAGAGVVGLGVAAYFGVRTRQLVSDSEPHCNANDTCDDQGIALRDDARSAQTAGLILAGVGAALLGSGVLIYVLAPSASGAGSGMTSSLVVGPAALSGRVRW
jgi:hypothetical protein